MAGTGTRCSHAPSSSPPVSNIGSWRWTTCTGSKTRVCITPRRRWTGAEPSTAWLAGCLALDGKGFVKTGAALTVDELVAAKWPLRRQPYLLETSIPGVLAVGDVRSGSTKRVASAVGEGSIAIATVHQVLAE